MRGLRLINNRIIFKKAYHIDNNITYEEIVVFTGNNDNKIKSYEVSKNFILIETERYSINLNLNFLLDNKKLGNTRKQGNKLKTIKSEIIEDIKEVSDTKLNDMNLDDIFCQEDLSFLLNFDC